MKTLRIVDPSLPCMESYFHALGYDYVLVTLLKMGRYYNTTMRHYWDILVK